MKKFLFLISLFCAPAFAAEPDNLSLALGYTAIGSEVGITASAVSPYFLNNHKTAIGIQYSIFEERSYHTYAMPQINAIHQIMKNESASLYFKNGVALIEAKNLSDTGSLGINFALGGNLDIGSERVKLQAETGYFLSFGRADKTDGQPFARGAGVALGFAFML